MNRNQPDIYNKYFQELNTCTNSILCTGTYFIFRDLKPENFLLKTKEPDSPIKIIDFGLSSTFGNDHFKIKIDEGLKRSK